MARYTVPLKSWANIAVDVEAPDDATPEQIAELAMEEAYASVCNGCSSKHNNSLDVGDVWEPVLNEDGVPEVTPID
jgi:hypothetical protein